VLDVMYIADLNIQSSSSFLYSLIFSFIECLHWNHQRENHTHSWTTVIAIVYFLHKIERSLIFTQCCLILILKENLHPHVCFETLTFMLSGFISLLFQHISVRYEWKCNVNGLSYFDVYSSKRDCYEMWNVRLITFFE
jgi:hypothetical protein